MDVDVWIFCKLLSVNHQCAKNVNCKFCDCFSPWCFYFESIYNILCLPWVMHVLFLNVPGNPELGQLSCGSILGCMRCGNLLPYCKDFIFHLSFQLFCNQYEVRITFCLYYICEHLHSNNNYYACASEDCSKILIAAQIESDWSISEV